jgi:hypothetical protein
MMNKVKKRSNSECYTPLLDPLESKVQNCVNNLRFQPFNFWVLIIKVSVIEVALETVESVRLKIQCVRDLSP